MQEFTALANRLADIAGEIARKYYRQPFDVESKGDNSPVTIADREIEKAMRALIEKERPDDGIFGEEFGIKDSKNGYTWVLDPIDGTTSFVIGRPTFGTLVALCKDKIPVLGVIDQPILRERWVGVKGKDTTFNGQIVKTRSCAKMADARVASTALSMFKGLPPIYEDFERVAQTMTWGGDCTSYGLLTSGYIDIVVEAALKPYDFAAIVPVIEGAGGMICDWEGNKLTLDSGERVIALGDKSLWNQAKPLLRIS